MFSFSSTQSIGLLSYTFLKSTGKEDVVVPIFLCFIFGHDIFSVCSLQLISLICEFDNQLIYKEHWIDLMDMVIRRPACFYCILVQN